MILLHTFLVMQPALALDCYPSPKVWPSLWTVEADLPVNSVPMVYYSFSSLEESPFLLALSDASENSPTETLEISDAAYHFTPQQSLEANSEYVFGPEDDTVVYAKAYFSTGSSIDEDIPETPVVTEINRSTLEDEWGVWDYLVFTFEEQGDGVRYHSFEFADNPEFSDSYTRWELPSSNGTYSIGNAPACTSELSSAAMDSQLHIRITAYDAAGHASETAVFSYEPPAIPEETNPESSAETGEESAEEKEEASCSTIPVTTFGLWWLMSLVGLRRR